MTFPWSNPATSLVVIISSTGFTGLFLYSPSAGAGNLKASIAPASGTDPFGNSYKGPGFTSYAGNNGTDLITFMTAGLIQLTTNIAVATVPTIQSDSAGTTLFLKGGSTGPVPPWVQMKSGITAITTDILSGWDPKQVTHTTTETWHDISTFSNAWSLGANGYVKYAMLPIGASTSPGGIIAISVRNLVPGTTTNGTVVVSSANGVDSSYAPTVHRQPYVGTGSTGSAGLELQADGSIQCFGAASATRFDGTGLFPCGF